jgi:hypothetical protein
LWFCEIVSLLPVRLLQVVELSLPKAQFTVTVPFSKLLSLLIMAFRHFVWILTYAPLCNRLSLQVYAYLCLQLDQMVSEDGPYTSLCLSIIHSNFFFYFLWNTVSIQFSSDTKNTCSLSIPK